MAQPIRARLAESTRVEAFSDGVFAVAITILVLELHAPEGRGEFLSELLDEWQAYVAYFAAFAIIGVIWMTHHAMYTRIARVDTRLISHNLLELLTVSLLPFAAAVVSNASRVGDKSDQTVGVILFSIVSLSVSLSWYALCAYLERAPHLLADDADQATLRRERRLQPITFAVPFAAGGVAFIAPTIGLLVLVALPVFYVASTVVAENRATD